jgi:PTH1 family peptidyl-tRNA hydrolase
MLLLAGLGNPGPDYAATRHNIGFMAADAIVRRHGFSPWRKRFRGEWSEGTLDGVRCFALKPMTFMNNSGESVGEAMRFFKLPSSALVVLYDELDLAPGKLRVKTGGGAAGHNGIRSIDAHLDDVNYRRVRLGIGHPGDKGAVLHWVLHPFAKTDRTWLEPLLDAVADAAPLLAKGNDAQFMTKVALLTQPPKQES